MEPRAPRPVPPRWRWFLPAVAVVVVAILLPVVLRGAPLADDYDACVVAREQGLGRAFTYQWNQRGVVRPIHYAEIALIAQCDRLPFGVLMLPGLALTVGVGFALRGLIRDLGAGEPAASIAGATWLIQPLGSEIALWPSAVHVPLGLLLCVLSLRALRARRDALGLLLGLAACLNLEQLIFAMPVLVWLVVPAPRRRRLVLLTGVYVVAVLAAYSLFPGTSPRNNVALLDRVVNVGRDLDFFVRFPAIGLGLHSGLQALRWQPGVAALVLVALGAGGAWAAPRLLSHTRSPLRLRPTRAAVAAAALAVAVNLPALSYAPRDDSPRLFSPSWLLVAAAVGLLVAAVDVRRVRRVGAIAGVITGVCLLSLALSVSVRLRHADISRAALVSLAAQVPEGGTAVVCEVPPKAVTPAPAGAFALHDLFYDWSAEPALTYHTGRHADITIVYQPCPDATGDVVVDFADLAGQSPGGG